MPNRRMGQARGRQTILECIITAFPATVNYWEKDGRRLTSSAKYHVDVYDDGHDHRIVLYVLLHRGNICPRSTIEVRPTGALPRGGLGWTRPPHFFS